MGTAAHAAVSSASGTGLSPASAMLSFAQRKERLADDMRAVRGTDVGLAKKTSNLFRDRKHTGAPRLDVSGFNHVLHVDPAQDWVDVEGMTPYDKLVEATLQHGVMPCVVPQLKSITIG